MDDMHRAGIGAGAAAYALGVIKHGQEVLHRDGAAWAGLCALGATDTAGCTHLACERALVVVGAAYGDHRALCEHPDSAVRAILCAESATGTAAGDDSCNAVRNDDGVIGAVRRAVAETDAGVGTNIFALPMSRGFLTGLIFRAGRNLFVLLGGVAGAVASDISEHPYGLARLDTEDGGDRLRCVGTAGNAEVCLLDLAVCKSVSIAVASAVAAGTAVGAGKGIADGEKFIALLNTEKDICNSQHDRANSRDGKTDKYGNKYFHLYIPL